MVSVRVMMKDRDMRRRLFMRAAFCGFASLVVAACARPRTEVVAPTAMARAALEQRIGPAGTPGPVHCRADRICGSDVLPGFYRKRDLRPAWIDDALELGNARAFVSALALVTDDGLDPENYHRAAIVDLLGTIDRATQRPPLKIRAEDLADLEMLLTDGFLLCGSHLLHGQVDPTTFHSDWHIKGRVEDLAAALEKGLAANDIPGALDSLRPSFPQYTGLRRACARCRAQIHAGGWPAFPVGPKLVKRDRGPRVEALRKTLAAMGELPEALPSASSDDPDLFDGRLEAAVKSFQLRHGLEPDGVVGVDTEVSLNVSASGRLTQIRANLERWRWVTQDLGDRYVLVNIAGYFVWVIEAGRPVLTMNAIVGKAYRQTPEFSSRITRVTIDPSWNVPPKLAREDILPHIKEDPGYLRKMGFRVFAGWTDGASELDPASIDWARITEDNLTYKFSQDPGPLNALGRLVVTFPNPFDVYIHDTPAHGLFLRAARDLSSGCIRVENALDLVAYILRDDPGWTRDKILAAIDAGATIDIPVPKPLNVHVLYWTAWLGDDDRIQFREDVYLRDAALLKALEEKAAASTS